MITLGKRVTDRISGFTGIAMSRTEYLYGCVRIAVEPQELKDGKVLEPGYFDEQRLEEYADETGFEQTVAPVPVAAAKEARTGGPGDAPPERRSPPARESHA